MDLLIIILISIATIIISKDAYVEDKNASIQEIISNLDTNYSSTVSSEEQITLTNEDEEKLKKDFLQTEVDISIFQE